MLEYVVFTVHRYITDYHSPTNAQRQGASTQQHTDIRQQQHTGPHCQ
jgi:hypothetical protein